MFIATASRFRDLALQLPVWLRRIFNSLHSLHSQMRQKLILSSAAAAGPEVARSYNDRRKFHRKSELQIKIRWTKCHCILAH